MGKDVLYVFNKLTSHGSILGEIQADFNMNLTIDGTKDSCSVLVYSYSGAEVEPYSPIYHPKTDTWWCVSHDKVERYAHDSGYMYIHNLELNGAIEILNARDLTDCGFRDKRYTFEDFIYRLFDLSNYKVVSRIDESTIYVGSLVINCDFYDLDTKIDFIKTFENYTLLSALREFLDAFNMSAKLSYTLLNEEGSIFLQNTILNIIPKTGSSLFGVHNIDDFNDIRETKTLDKNSFGASVVSNAENVISSVPKTFPSTGALKPISKEYILKAENAILKLPSKVYKLNWLKLVNTRANIWVSIHYETGSTTGWVTITEDELNINAYDDASVERGFNLINQRVRQYFPDSSYEDFADSLTEQMESIKNDLKKASTMTLYDDFEISTDIVNNSVKQIINKGENAPYLAKVNYYSKGDLDKFYERYLLCTDKTTRENLQQPWTAIYWERGSDEIAGFDGFEPTTGRSASLYLLNLKYTDLQVDIPIAPRGGDDSYDQTYVYFIYDDGRYSVTISTQAAASYPFRFLGSVETELSMGHITNFIVNYIPMSDIKIKVDNRREQRDVQLYNQNGKLTDGVALSKLINSYAKEIASDNITRYAYYRNFDNVPKVGSIVVYNGLDYVVNNVSLSFVQNEHNTSGDTTTSDTMISDKYFGYYIEAEISMSQYCSTKSLMVNPNTNIRDYGIPQNYNVKRKQLYRDFYELNYSLNEDTENDCYLTPDKVFTFEHQANQKQDYICLMKLSYSEQIEGQSSWYYQLETTRYNFNKMFYVVLDFKDNNIIGYANQSVFSGFVISRVFSGLLDTVNTPISYVDSNGSFSAIDILWLTNIQLTEDYYAYMDAHPSSDQTSWLNNGNTLYNNSVFIPQEVYDYANSNSSRRDMKISIYNYKKDALEVPVFEYGCQVDDTKDVIIGDNILNEYNDTNIIYFYSYKKGHNLGTDVTPESHVTYIDRPIGFRRFALSNAAVIRTRTGGEWGLASFLISFYAQQSWYISNKTWENLGQEPTIDANYDYAIFRHAFNLNTQEEIVDLLFIAKNVPASSIDLHLLYGRNIVLKLNHYKLN